MAEKFVVDMVREEMERAGDTSESVRTRAQLQAAVGAGTGDVESALDELRIGGLVTEVAPGEWEWLSEEVREERAGARNGAAVAPEPEVPLSADPRRRPAVEETPDVWVTLTFGVARSLDAASLGALVEAGIAEASENGVAFMLEVKP